MSRTLLSTSMGSVTVALDPGSLMAGLSVRHVAGHLALQLAAGPLWLTLAFRL